jgi:hypothetical protein
MGAGEPKLFLSSSPRARSWAGVGFVNAFLFVMPAEAAALRGFRRAMATFGGRMS